MKSIKTTLLTVMFLTTFMLISQLQHNMASATASYRVRTVPSSSEQKKKEPAPEAETPKVQTKQASNQASGYCNDAEVVKAKLAVVNGGAPK